MTLRVQVVDDQALVRRGFAMVLGNEPDIEVVAEAGTGSEAIEAARTHQPDIILMDIRMPGMDGLQATAQILEERGDTTRVIILTTFDPDEYVYRALRAGASGFVLKDIPRNRWWPQCARSRQAVPCSIPRLPPSDRTVRGKTGRGAELCGAAGTPDRTRARGVAVPCRRRSNQEIADALFIGPATVKSHVSSLLAKLELRDRRRRWCSPTNAGWPVSVSGMSDSDPPAQAATGLCRIAAVSGVAIGALLLAGAWGHFAAIWDRLGDPDASRLSLLAPGIFLTVAGVINGALCVSIWAARHWAHWLALATNLFATGYFALLLSSRHSRSPDRIVPRCCRRSYPRAWRYCGRSHLAARAPPPTRELQRLACASLSRQCGTPANLRGDEPESILAPDRQRRLRVGPGEAKLGTPQSPIASTISCWCCSTIGFQSSLSSTA